ncbi:fungal hydrophobin [Agrocybe pediades]|nr:fungal hydrophobin [Agrocybe pediades]
MQFTSVIALAVAASPIFAAATPVVEARDGDCNTGSTLCCNQVQASNSTSITQLAGLLGIALPSLGLLAGLSCSPLNILGIGGNSCSSQPVCCSQNNFGGLLALGCNPINLNL